MRLAVLFCVVVTVIALVVRYPAAIADLHRSAHDNAALSLLDREVGGGNSVVADQSAMLEARARIPEDGTYEVVIGDPQPGWSDLTSPFIALFSQSFLLPRRQEQGAPWVLCYACDRDAIEGAVVVWEGDDGVSLLKRPT